MVVPSALRHCVSTERGPELVGGADGDTGHPRNCDAGPVLVILPAPTDSRWDSSSAELPCIVGEHRCGGQFGELAQFGGGVS
jgi:hypothetical protein